MNNCEDGVVVLVCTLPDCDVCCNAEMVVPEVDKKLLEELESMGFSTTRATRALHYSGELTRSLA